MVLIMLENIMDSFGQMSAAIGLPFLGARMVELEEHVSNTSRVYMGDKQTVKKKCIRISNISNAVSALIISLCRVAIFCKLFDIC